MNLKNSVLSFSSLSRFAESPLSFVDYKLNRTYPTPAMVLGTLVHRRVLEPEEYEKTVHVWPARRAGQAWKDFQEQHSTGDIITATESDKIEAISASIKTHRMALHLLQQCHEFEMEVRFSHEGVPHRGFIDARGPGFIIDLKITQNVNARDLQRMIYERRYYMQAAIYMQGLSAMGYDVDDAYIIAVQSQRPFQVTCVRLPGHYIVRGHTEWMRLLDMWKSWDGYPSHSHGTEDIIEIDAPTWAPIPDGMKGDKRAQQRQTL